MKTLCMCTTQRLWNCLNAIIVLIWQNQRLEHAIAHPNTVINACRDLNSDLRHFEFNVCGTLHMDCESDNTTCCKKYMKQQLMLTAMVVN